MLEVDQIKFTWLFYSHTEVESIFTKVKRSSTSSCLICHSRALLGNSYLFFIFRHLRIFLQISKHCSHTGSLHSSWVFSSSFKGSLTKRMIELYCLKMWSLGAFATKFRGLQEFLHHYLYIRNIDKEIDFKL